MARNIPSPTDSCKSAPNPVPAESGDIGLILLLKSAQGGSRSAPTRTPLILKFSVLNQCAIPDSIGVPVRCRNTPSSCKASTLRPSVRYSEYNSHDVSLTVPKMLLASTCRLQRLPSIRTETAVHSFGQLKSAPAWRMHILYCNRNASPTD
jgi:hypothetical protein